LTNETHRLSVNMPELPDVTVYIEALNERVLDQPMQKIRIGSPFMTTRGMKQPDFGRVGELIGHVLARHEEPGAMGSVKQEVTAMARKFSLFSPEWITRVSSEGVRA